MSLTKKFKSIFVLSIFYANYTWTNLFRSKILCSTLLCLIFVSTAFAQDNYRDSINTDYKREQQIENYNRTNIQLDSGEILQQWKNPLIKIKTVNGLTFSGNLQNVFNDTVVLAGVETQMNTEQNPDETVIKIGLNEISEITLPKKSEFWKYAGYWGLIPAAAGAVVGLASGDDPGGLVSFTAGQKAVIAGGLLGFIGFNIGGSIGALKGVDVDIPWQNRSLAEKRAILSQLRSGKYRSPHPIRVSPWVGGISDPHGKTVANFGGRLRDSFAPRSGVELTYGTSQRYSVNYQYYSDLINERIKVTDISGSFFIAFSRNRLVNPFVTWGWGMLTTTVHRKTSWEIEPGKYSEWKEKDVERFLSLNLFGGVEIPVTKWFSLEARVGKILKFDEPGHFCFQLGLNISSKF